MQQQGPVLVPLDGSEVAERALPYAAAVARALGAPVLLVSVRRPAATALRARRPEQADRVERETEAAARSYLEEASGRLDAALAPETAVRAGEPAEEIVSLARERGARLLVISTHGRSGIRRWIRGSVATRILRDATAPVLVVGPNVPAPVSPVSLRHLAVPLDGSPVAEAALPVAAALARALGARVALVRVVAWAVESYPFSPVALSLPELDDELEADAHAYLDTHRTAVGDAETVILHGHAADRLCAFVEAERIDLVVMTTHARSPVTRAVMGSTADRVIQCPAPVLLIRPQAG
ncbi:MAG: universal stress protein [Chloroflexota bacterium]|nr:universal stress protein [Chloroflexota bacterium]